MFTKNQRGDYMNIQECDIMNDIARDGYENQRVLTERTGYSLGKVNQSLNALIKESYLTKDYAITEKSEKNSVDDSNLELNGEINNDTKPAINPIFDEVFDEQVI